MKTVAIIGAGITGLTAAYRLQERGYDVTVLEASNHTGGVIRTFRDQGYLAEHGPNTLLESSPKIGELVDDLGLRQRLLYSSPEAKLRFILKNGRPVALPTSPPAFLGSPLFSAKAKMRLFAEPFIKRSSPDEEETLAHFVKRRLGQEFLDYAINPFVAGVYAGDPHRLSVKEAFPKLLAVEQQYGSLIKGQILGARERKRKGEVSKANAKTISFDHGLQVLVDRLTDKLEGKIQLETAVTKLESTDTGIQVAAKNQRGDSERVYDAVLLAIPAYNLAELALQSPTAPSLAPLKEITYPPVASVVMGFRRDQVAHPLNGFGTLNPEVEKRKTLGTLFTSSLFPGRAPEGHVLLTSYVGGMRSPELGTQDEDSLYAMTLEDLRSIYGVTGEPTFRHCTKYAKAIPQYDVGYGRYKDLMAQCEVELPGLFLGGHSRDGISLADSIVSGTSVAERIASA